MLGSQSKNSQSQSDAYLPNRYELSKLIAALEQTAKTLLVLQKENTPGTHHEPAVNVSSPKNDGEIRSYYFPPATLHHERELLSKYRADDFQDLLEEVHSLLVGLVVLMKSAHKDARVKGYVISSLEKQIEHASALILRMRNVYDKVMPVQK